MKAAAEERLQAARANVANVIRGRHQDQNMVEEDSPMKSKRKPIKRKNLKLGMKNIKKKKGFNIFDDDD